MMDLKHIGEAVYFIDDDGSLNVMFVCPENGPIKFSDLSPEKMKEFDARLHKAGEILEEVLEITEGFKA